MHQAVANRNRNRWQGPEGIPQRGIHDYGDFWQALIEIAVGQALKIGKSGLLMDTPFCGYSFRSYSAFSLAINFAIARRNRKDFLQRERERHLVSLNHAQKAIAGAFANHNSQSQSILRDHAKTTARSRFIGDAVEIAVGRTTTLKCGANIFFVFLCQGCRELWREFW